MATGSLTLVGFPRCKIFPVGIAQEGAPESGKLMTLLGAERMEMLRLASLAPNGHNTQPWTVEILDKDRWRLGSDAARWLPAADPTNHDILISLGAFLQNLALAGSHFGLETEIDLLATAPRDTAVAEIRLKPAARREAPLAQIQARRTLRKHFQTRPIAADDLRFVAQDAPRQIVYFPADSAGGRYLTEGTLEANRLQTYRDPAQAELADWIRWGGEEAEATCDGLTPASMEISGIAGWYVRSFFNRDDVLSKRFREKTMETVAEQVKTLAGWIVVTARDSSVAALLDTGKILQNLALRGCAKKIALHPMTQMLQEGEWMKTIGPMLGIDDPVQMAIRAGYVENYPTPVSLRRPVERFARLEV
jgi:hypothetical protein